MICLTGNAAGEVYPNLPPMPKIACKKNRLNMKLSALVRFSQQDVYMSLTILGCTVKFRFRFADCPLIHCEYTQTQKTEAFMVEFSLTSQPLK